ncbi:hypothetical protein [Streptosporangium subroseum]|uniref:hypothetical protein n=1 Tax=Streptosporangium subroseum TaxID=106412 RepID=UPI003093690E|nr:hypothetical protein OHB15_24955 [Streptosporangium subroseum]
MLPAAAFDEGKESLKKAHGRRLILAAAFVIIGSIGVLAPCATALSRGGEQRLHRMRGWLIQHNGALTLLLILVFAVLFLAKGLRGLLA